METKRAISKGAEKILEKEFPVLDSGFIRLVDYMGNDSAIVQAARVSYGEGTKKSSQDRELIKYLMKNQHTSPFEMVEMKWHAKMPIFVARQWIRHRTANINEISYRYSVPKMEFFIPSEDEIRYQSISNKQGSKDEKVPKNLSKKVIKLINSNVDKSVQDYNDMIDNNIARELSRIGLPINIYTEWYWKNDLKNTFHFLKLRMDKHAQKEIREYANKMGKIIKKIVPIAYEAFEDYVLDGISFSREEIEVVKDLLSGNEITESIQNIKNESEKKEFMEKYNKITN